MARRPPRSTLTDTLFPYRTLFRAARAAAQEIDEGVFEAGGHRSEPRLDPVGKRVDLFCPCLGAQHHADTGALDHPVADTVQIERLGKHGPPLLANLFEAKAPVCSARCQLSGRPGLGAFPLVAQPPAVAAVI